MDMPMKQIRFWIYQNNGAVLIKMKKGQSLAHFYSMRTDEGYNSGGNEWIFDGRTLTNNWWTDGRDCDGRISSSGECYCEADLLKSGYSDEAGIKYPRWRQGPSCQRDYQAELANY
jgi:hypothetical protein